MAHRVLSIDLAMESRRIGICVLEGTRRRSKLILLSPEDLKLPSRPDALQLALAILDYCSRHGVKVVLLDGPQAWKDPRSELPHSRRCERELSTQVKTGTAGNVKPAPALRFVQFCIDVFRHLVAGGANLVQNSPISVLGPLLAVETFPTSAWRCLGQQPLPSHHKATDEDIERRVRALREKFHVAITQKPNHDQIQAAVAGLAGLSIMEGDGYGYCLSGSPPISEGGSLCEGFIVNPRLTKFDRP